MEGHDSLTQVLSMWNIRLPYWNFTPLLGSFIVFSWLFILISCIKAGRQLFEDKRRKYDWSADLTHVNGSLWSTFAACGQNGLYPSNMFHIMSELRRSVLCRLIPNAVKQLIETKHSSDCVSGCRPVSVCLSITVTACHNDSCVCLFN